MMVAHEIKGIEENAWDGQASFAGTLAPEPNFGLEFSSFSFTGMELLVQFGVQPGRGFQNVFGTGSEP